MDSATPIDFHDTLTGTMLASDMGWTKSHEQGLRRAYGAPVGTDQANQKAAAFLVCGFDE
jgi:hypothetical protein